MPNGWTGKHYPDRCMPASSREVPCLLSQTPKQQQLTAVHRVQAHYRDYNQMTYARSVLVIHNMAHQGRGPMADLSNLEVPAHYNEHFRLYDPIGGEHMNIMKAGLLTAHRLVAVSHG